MTPRLLVGIGVVPDKTSDRVLRHVRRDDRAEPVGGNLEVSEVANIPCRRQADVLSQRQSVWCERKQSCAEAYCLRRKHVASPLSGRVVENDRGSERLIIYAVDNDVRVHEAINVSCSDSSGQATISISGLMSASRVRTTSVLFVPNVVVSLNTWRLLLEASNSSGSAMCNLPTPSRVRRSTRIPPTPPKPATATVRSRRRSARLA